MEYDTSPIFLKIIKIKKHHFKMFIGIKFDISHSI